MEKKDWINGDLIEWRCEEGWTPPKPARVLMSIIEIVAGRVTGKPIEVENWVVGNRWNSPLDPENGSFTFVRRPLRPDRPCCGKMRKTGSYCGCAPETSAPMPKAPDAEESERAALQQPFDNVREGMDSIRTGLLQMATVSKQDALACIDEQIATLQNLKRSLQPKKRWEPKPEPRTPVVGRFI